MRKRIYAFILSIILVLTSAVPAFAAVPKINAKITSKNVLSLLKAYDADGYYLVTQGKKAHGADHMFWFYGCDRIVDGVATAVHEQCHACTHGWDCEYIYKGNKKFYTVKYTDVFNSQQMASSVPEKLRTSRFATYVSEPDPYLSSDVDGVYGLLNEFTAYCWGMNNTVSLYNYYKKSGSDLATWDSFINDGANGRQAYAEFNYYILHYLYYAKQHYPAVYKQIMKNTSFKKAYKFIEKKFRKNITAYEKDLKKLIKYMKASGHNAVINGGYFWCDHSGTGLFETDYKNLSKEIKKSKYQKIYKKLIN